MTTDRKGQTEPRITPAMLDALRLLAGHGSLAGLCHGRTSATLKRHGLIKDSFTITDAGRAAIAQPKP